MLPTITSFGQFEANLRSYAKLADQYANNDPIIAKLTEEERIAFRKTLTMGRTFFGIEDASSYIFAPVKWAGHLREDGRPMDIQTYAETRKDISGSVGEAACKRVLAAAGATTTGIRVKRWSYDESDPLHRHIIRLTKMITKKRPSALASSFLVNVPTPVSDVEDSLILHLIGLVDSMNLSSEARQQLARNVAA